MSVMTITTKILMTTMMIISIYAIVAYSLIQANMQDNARQDISYKLTRTGDHHTRYFIQTHEDWGSPDKIFHTNSQGLGITRQDIS